MRAKLKLEKKVKEQLLNELDSILSTLKSEAQNAAAGSGLHPTKLQDALDAAKNGDFTHLEKLINDPKTAPALKDILKAYLKAAQMYVASQQPGTLDSHAVQQLEDALHKLLPSGIKDDLLAKLTDVVKWNDFAKMLEGLPDSSLGLGQAELSMALEIVTIVQQALAVIPFGPGYGAAPGYDYEWGEGYGYGATTEYPSLPSVPVAPLVSDPILLSNPAENSVTMPFLLNDEVTELEAGQYVELPPHQTWEIQFDRGGGAEAISYSLASGSYEFTQTDQGWDLVQSE